MSIQHSSATDRTGGIRLERAGTSKISWIAWFKPKSSWSEDNSFTTAGVYLSEHRLCSFTLGELRLPVFALGWRSAFEGCGQRPSIGAGRFVSGLLKHFAASCPAIS